MKGGEGSWLRLSRSEFRPTLLMIGTCFVETLTSLLPVFVCDAFLEPLTSPLSPAMSPSASSDRRPRFPCPFTCSIPYHSLAPSPNSNVAASRLPCRFQHAIIPLSTRNNPAFNTLQSASSIHQIPVPHHLSNLTLMPSPAIEIVTLI
jgi:hypothetical protein